MYKHKYIVRVWCGWLVGLSVVGAAASAINFAIIFLLCSIRGLLAPSDSQSFPRRSRVCVCWCRPRLNESLFPPRMFREEEKEEAKAGLSSLKSLSVKHSLALLLLYSRMTEKEQYHAGYYAWRGLLYYMMRCLTEDICRQIASKSRGWKGGKLLIFMPHPVS